MSFELLFSSQNLPFSVALTVVLALAILEGVGLIFGAGLSTLIEVLFPSVEVDFEMPDVGGGHSLGSILAWLRIGQVPIIILLILFLTSFAVIGLVLQIFISSMFGFLIPVLFVSLIAVFMALPCMRFLGGLINKFMPKDESSAVSIDSFIGRSAKITLGNAKVGSPAEAKIIDEFGRAHYVMLEPDDSGEAFDSNDKLLIVRHENTKFFAIRSTN